MTIGEIRNVATTCSQLAEQAASDGNARSVMTQGLMCSGWLMTAEICERLDKLIEQGEKGDG